MKKRLTADDFFTGLFAALALRRIKSVSIRGNSVDQALAVLFEDLQGRADAERLDIRFRIRTHPVHGDSETVRDAFAYAAQRGLISLDNPEFQDISLKLPEQRAEALLKELPGSEALYTQLAEKFLEAVE